MTAGRNVGEVEYRETQRGTQDTIHKASINLPRNEENFVGKKVSYRIIDYFCTFKHHHQPTAKMPTKNHHNSRLYFLILLFVFCSSSKCSFAQICDTLAFDYVTPSGNDFSLQSGSIQIDKKIDSHPIIASDNCEDTIPSMIYLHVFLNRKDLITKSLMINHSEIFFIVLTDAIRGKVNKISFFNSGEPPVEMKEEYERFWSLLDSHISEMINSWTWELLDEDVDAIPLEIDLLVPLHCNLGMSENIIDKFSPLY